MSRQNIDRRFQEKVWSWLTRHPEVSVGQEKEGNQLSLSNAEGTEASPQGQIRVFVAKERTWLAVTGHEPDEAKVLPTEFALLSIIASRKSQGILQTELVKLSGQDKRSVPKRTDMLQRKGYIHKRVIHVKPARTSLCILSKFSPQAQTYQSSLASTRGENTPEGHANDNVIDFQVFAGKFFDILREHTIISRDDLKRILGFADHWRWKFLSRSIRKFERIGVVRRVRAKSQYSESSKRLHNCLMLIREPSETDFEIFLEHGASLLSIPQEERDDANDELDEDLELEDPARETVPPGNLEIIAPVKQETVEELGRTLPIWTPDRNMYNLLFGIIDSSGTSGMANWVR